MLPPRLKTAFLSTSPVSITRTVWRSTLPTETPPIPAEVLTRMFIGSPIPYTPSRVRK